jgi:hypothetical protein
MDSGSVRVESPAGRATMTQELRLQNSQLVIVISTTLSGEPRYQTTFRYRRK